MKCYTFHGNAYLCGVVLEGIPVTHSGNQYYLALPVCQGDPCKVFLTERAIDKLEIVNNMPCLYDARLVLQGDGTHWLDVDDSPGDSALLLYSQNSEWRSKDREIDFPFTEPGRKILSSTLKIYGLNQDRHVIVRESTFPTRDWTKKNLLSVFMRVQNGMRIPVSRVTKYRVPGTGFSLLTPLRAPVYRERVNIHNSIEYRDGQFTVKDLE